MYVFHGFKCFKVEKKVSLWTVKRSKIICDSKKGAFLRPFSPEFYFNRYRNRKSFSVSFPCKTQALPFTLNSRFPCRNLCLPAIIYRQAAFTLVKTINKSGKISGNTKGGKWFSCRFHWGLNDSQKKNHFGWYPTNTTGSGQFLHYVCSGQDSISIRTIFVPCYSFSPRIAPLSKWPQK